MQVLLTDNNKNFQDSIYGFLKAKFKSIESSDLKRLWQELFKNSFIKPEQSILDEALLVESVSKHLSGLGLFLLTQFTCINIINNFANKDIRNKYLNKLRSGEAIGSFSITEPNAGSDVSLIETTAVKNNNNWILNGHKIWASNGSICDLIITFAQTKSHKDKSGITAFLLDPNSKQIKIKSDTPKLGVKITPSNEITINNAEITEEAKIGDIGDGIKIALSAITLGRIYCAAQAVGLLGGLLEECINHSTKRNQFGKSISEYQSIKWYLADMTKDLDAARLLLHKACWAKENSPEELSKYSSMAKYFSTSVTQKHATKAVQILGGRGLIEGSYVAKGYNDSKVLEIYEGTNEIQKLVLTKELKLN
ncbi:MAG: hypothetical protein A3B68_03825 [Candidatus Melainabacteria bacterium RIFCSPHIGHO2_02_FULL_34_12]|nr:MAG: hypothetical protein A3B68_03825 [Candidatus Melainabacteria bacterium RIFCSPHIGHO2_02_FULL_34_12]